MHLDTMEYYKFLHPSSVYVNTEPAGNGLTQIAPFVSLDGVLQPVHQLYIDEQPVFFSQARQLSRSRSRDAVSVDFQGVLTPRDPDFMSEGVTARGRGR